ncbi:MAG: glutathione S-transferase [Shimia sp.]
MTYDLFIGDRTYSSWSLRGWLMLEAFGLPKQTHLVGLYDGTMAQDLAPLAPARTVPVLRTPEGHVIQDTLAMAETLAERHPDAGLWPSDPAARAKARWLVAEMHAGFTALRTECPMNLEHAWVGFAPSEAVLADVARIETLWDYAGGDGWLFGDYSLADVFYAPVAARIAGYDLSVGDAAQSYVARHLSHTPFRQWRAMGPTRHYDPAPYRIDARKAPWPGPARLPARAVEGTGAENDACPYSGREITHCLELDGRRFGFCNAFCRDKTVADPGAWPAFMALYRG